MAQQKASNSMAPRLRLGLLLLAILPVVLGLGALQLQYVVHERDRLYEQYQARASQVSLVVDHLLRQADQELGLVQRFRSGTKEDMLLDMLHHENLFNSIAYLDADAQVLAFVSRREVSTPGGHRRAYQETVARARQTGERSFGSISVDPTSGEPWLPLVQPVRDLRTGRITGLVVAELALKRVSNTLRDLVNKAPERGEDVFVLDSNRQVIAHVNPSRVLGQQHFAAVPAVPAGLGRDLEGRLAVIASSRLNLPGNELITVVTTPVTTAFSLLFIQLGVGATVLMLALALAWWLQRRIVQGLLLPVQRLTESARRITEGQTDLRAPEEAAAEMGELARAINVMLDRLVGQRAELEQRVAERTAELEVAKDQALEAGQMLQIVLDTIPVRIFWKDRNLVYMGCNRLFAKDAGCAYPAEVVGQTDYDLCWHELAEQYRAGDARVIRSGEPQLDYEEPQKTEDGQMLWLRTSKVPIRDADGEVIGVLGMYEDISPRKRIEEELRSAKEAAEAASRAKSLFLTSMSHELRTPLNAILGYAQLMEMMPGVRRDLQGNAREIRQAGEMLLTLVNSILDLARVEAGHFDVAMQTVSLSGVLAECLAHNEPMAQNRHVTLAVDAACGGLFVKADSRRLLQVLNNLVSNAVKYNHPNGRVDIACTRGQAGHLRIEVRDTGLGLTAQQQAQLFQPFNRLGAEMGSTQGGGIGLVLCRRLMDAMQGRIGVDSPRSGGSTFWIELQQAQGGQVATSPGDGMRVLVAEDYGPNQKILQRQLASLGLQADIRGDGDQALRAWREGHYDLLLTDLNMPLMDGLALTRSIRQEELTHGSGRMPVIGVTAASEIQEIQKCLEAGMDEVLCKPIELGQLREILDRWGWRKATLPSLASVPGLSSANPQILDVEQSYRVLGHRNAADANDLIQIFLQTASEGLTQLDSTVDMQTLAREMHKQKSSARTVGAVRYAALAESLELQSKTGDAGRVEDWIEKLQQALVEVREQARHVGQSAMPMGEGRPHRVQDESSLDCNSVLLVDDDPVVIKQLSSLLQNLGVAQVLTASNGVAAIEVAARYGDALDVVVSDLSMPSMDGVELIRRFGQTGFKGGIVLMSGADLPILRTVHELAVMQGLRVLGEVRKPVLPRELIALLQRRDLTPMPLRRLARGPEITHQAIRDAMRKNEFEVWFQPKVDAQTLLPVGLEALARWRRPDGSYAPPDLFITLAERDGLIGELSTLLLQRALDGALQVMAAGYALKLAINLSGGWLDDLNLPDAILEKVLEVGMQPGDLVLEVTETRVMDDVTTALDVLTRFRLKGFGLSIDDFGIGYSSFEQIGRIPFTEMKLDRSFVNKGGRDVAARAILESSMGMAQKLGLVTVAEGVETENDLELVRMLGCDSVQGYLIAKPMPLDDLLVWLEAASARK